MLDINQSRIRQKRLLDKMAEAKLDAIVVGLPHHVYYFSTFYTNWLHQSAFVLFADGRSWLMTANSPAKNVAADEVFSYEAQWMATLRQEQPEVVGGKIAGTINAYDPKRVGVDTSQVTSQVTRYLNAEVEWIDPILWQLRRQKDQDEWKLMQEAVDAAAAMYDHARKIIEPGICELDVYTQLHQVAVKTTGEPMSALLGNDWVSGPGGGPPRRDGRAKAGEIYILDLGPSYRGYFADTSRAFAVDRRPTDAQIEAQNDVIECLKIVERMARPGVKCATLFSAVDEHLKEKRGKGMAHHLGHGVGLQPHEFPHLNPKWDDVLLEGEVFTAEPGVYGPALGGGIRLENDYVVTKDGVRNLLNSPLELTQIERLCEDVGMSQLTSIAPESPPLAQIDYLTPVARPKTRALALVMTSIIAIVLVCAGGMMLFDILQLARDESGHAAGAILFAGMFGVLAGISFCGAGVIFYLVTRTLLRLTAT